MFVPGQAYVQGWYACPHVRCQRWLRGFQVFRERHERFHQNVRERSSPSARAFSFGIRSVVGAIRFDGVDASHYNDGLNFGQEALLRIAQKDRRVL